MVTFDDLTKVHMEDRAKTQVKDVLTKSLTVTYPDASMQTALDDMCERNVGRLPVVDRADPTQLVGIITHSDIVRAYEMATARAAE
jgi:CIC family chloride channel protein